MHPTAAPSALLRAYAFLAIVMLLWAGNSIVGRAVRDDIPPFTLALVRWAGAAMILVPFAWRRLRVDAPALRAHWRQVLVLGLLGVAAFNAFLYSGLHYTTATNAMLIQAAIPALVVLFGRIFFGERARALQILGVIASTIGVAWVVSAGDIDTLLHLRLGAGDALILAASLVWSLYTVLLRLRPEVDPLSFLVVTFAIGALAMLPLAVHEWLNGDAVTLAPRRLRRLRLCRGAALDPRLFPLQSRGRHDRRRAGRTDDHADAAVRRAARGAAAGRSAPRLSFLGHGLHRRGDCAFSDSWKERS